MKRLKLMIKINVKLPRRSSRSRKYNWLLLGIQGSLVAALEREAKKLPFLQLTILMTYIG